MPCPEPRKLQQLLDESLAAGEQQAIQTHLETCTQCQRKLEQLAAGGVTRNKAAESRGAEPHSGETALADAAAKLQSDSTDPDQTRAEAVAAPLDEDLSFLQPS